MKNQKNKKKYLRKVEFNYIIRYRKITSNGIGEAIPGIGDEEVAVMDESTVRRNKNSSVIQKGYVYRG